MTQRNDVLTVSHVPPSLKSGDIVYNNTAEGDKSPLCIVARNGDTFELRRLFWYERLRHGLARVLTRIDLWLMFKRWAIERNFKWAWLWLRAVNPFETLFTIEDFRMLRQLVNKKTR